MRFPEAKAVQQCKQQPPSGACGEGARTSLGVEHTLLHQIHPNWSLGAAP